MIEGKTSPLEHAKKVLRPSTIERVNHSPYNHFGWSILDRWAYNSPKALQDLEQHGEIIVLGRLLEQQELEQEALMTDAALEARSQGTMPFEILQALEIKTELLPMQNQNTVTDAFGPGQFLDTLAVLRDRARGIERTPTDWSACPATLDTFDSLRAQHRAVAEQIVDANRKAQRVLEQNRLVDIEDDFPLSAHLEVLLEEQADIEQGIKAILARLQADQKARLADDPNLASGGSNGLAKIRHPNRDFFLANMFDYALKDDGASMEAPIFTLSTKPDLSVWEWKSQDGNKHVKVTPSVLGRATQHDKDVLIFIVSQMTAGLNRGREDAKSRTVRFTVYDFLVSTNRDTSGHGYKLLTEAFERLRGTSITTDIRTGGQRVREGFGIIDKWKVVEKSPTDERMIAVEVTLSEWLYNAVQAFDVLTIHDDYFRLRKPLARRLYEIARKHLGRDKPKFTFVLANLQQKAGSKSTLKEFRRAVRAIEADDSLPEYRMVLTPDDRVTFYTRDTRLLAKFLADSLQPTKPTS